MGTIANGQTCLENRGYTERHREIVKNDYSNNDQYSSLHKDAISDGDAQGKGTGHGGHTHWLPDCTKPTTAYDYSNFDTTEGGGLYDIEGRNDIGGRKRMMSYCLYNSDEQYGVSAVDTAVNVADGQIIVE